MTDSPAAETVIATLVRPAPPAAVPRWLNMVNLFLPGTRVAALGRPWTGVGIALLWAATAHVTIAGWLLVPDAWPRWITWCATGLAVVTWVTAVRLLR